jgi:hypothetical protein
MRPGRLLLPVLAIAASAAFAAGGTVYKWKDAKGGLHFSDTPPPAGAILISGPKPAAAREGAVDAPPGIQRDAKTASDALPPGSAPAAAAGDPQVAAVRAQECELLRHVRIALERRRTGESTEILTDEERAALPADIAATDGRIATDCP